MSVGRHKQRADFNWALVSKLGLAAAFIVFILMNHVQVQCVFSYMDGAQLQGLADDSDFTDHVYRPDSPDSPDVAQVGAATGFLGRFFGGFKHCYAAAPLTSAPPWQPLTMLGGIVLFFVGRQLAKAQFKANVRRAARTTASPAAIRASGSRTAAHTAANHVAGGSPRRATSASEAVAAPRPTRASRPSGAPSIGNDDPLERRLRDTGSDVLSALDDELDLDSPPRHTGEFDREPSSIRRPPTSRSAAIPTDSFVQEFDAPPSPERTAFDDGPPSRVRSNATLAFDDDDWGDEDDDLLLSGSSPVVGVESTAQVDAVRSAPSPTAAFAAIGHGSGREAVVVRLPNAWRLGDDLLLAIAVESATEAPALDTVISISAVSSDARVTELWDFPRPAHDFEGHEGLDDQGRALVTIPFDDLYDAIAEMAQYETFDLASLRVNVSLGDVESIESVPVFDTLHVEFTNRNGTPVRPSLLRLRTPDGATRRAIVGADRPGSLAIASIAPARFELEFEDHAALVTADGSMARRAAIDSEGLAILRGAPPETRELTRRLLVHTPDVIFVAARGEDISADGTIERPFGTLQAALDHVRSLREHADDVSPVELRLEAGTLVPSDRPGLVDGNTASSEWVAWWEGHAANTDTAWTAPAEGDTLRELSRPAPGTALEGDGRIERLDHVYLVNASYADLREQAVRDHALVARLDEAYGALPMSVIAGPDSDSNAAFRLVITDCADVRLEGIHLLGIRGQSGVQIVDSFDVQLIRCWLDHFESGTTGRSGHFAVGRALQIERSGDENAPVELTWCDIGWNRAVRRSMPVRGAALGAYNSVVHLSRCYVHDNVANAKPVDVTKDGESEVTGDPTNHRAGSRSID